MTNFRSVAYYSRLLLGIEELLRHTGAMQYMRRTTTSAVTRHGRRMSAVVSLSVPGTLNEHGSYRSHRCKVTRVHTRMFAFQDGAQGCRQRGLAGWEVRVTSSDLLAGYGYLQIKDDGVPVEHSLSPVLRDVARWGVPRSRMIPIEVGR